MKLLNVYQLYIVKKYFQNFIKVTGVFICLILIMNLLEEINFFRNTDEKVLIPIYLTILNLPSILFEIFPFIFLITSILFFLDMLDSNEIKTLKTFGVTNLKILNILGLSSLITGILIITLFYSLSTSFKSKYLETKNKFTKDDKYLAVITANGLWIRDVIEGNINFISADRIIDNNLINVTITKFDENLKLEKSIFSKKVDINNYSWFLNEPVVNINNKREKFNTMEFRSNFNLDKLLSLFNNLSALSLFEIESLKKDYELLGYSTKLLDNFKLKIYLYPLYLTLMALTGSILMLNIKHDKPKIFHIIMGIIISVVIYYISYFTENITETKDLPYYTSTISVQIILFVIIAINLQKINEK